MEQANKINLRVALQIKLILLKIKMGQALRTIHLPEVRMIQVVLIVKIRITLLRVKINRIKTQHHKIILQINRKTNRIL